MGSTTIVIISDIHDGRKGAAALPGSHDLTRTLLKRAVRRINRFIRPHAVAILGDLVDSPRMPGVAERLAAIKEILDLLEAPYVAIPGNRDPGAELFYSVFERPRPFVDCGAVRLVPFVDRLERGVPVQRTAEEAARRLGEARSGFAGPIVTLQHVAVTSPGTGGSMSEYAQADGIARARREAGVLLDIGGHYHRTAGLESDGNSKLLAVSPFGEAPFTFTVVQIAGDNRVEVAEHALQMPRKLGLVDVHTHSQFAYCSKGMQMTLTPPLAELFGLAGVALTEHSGQLYFERGAYWKGAFGELGIATQEGRSERIGEFWETVEREWDPALWAGLEIDADYSGGLVVRPEDFRRSQIRNGAVHYLRELKAGENADPSKVADEFMQATEGLVRSGIDVLCHPFRVFRRAGLSVPDRLFEPVARLLARHGVAAEVNFHTNEPDPRFFRLCIEMGVKVAFGSDAHEPWEVGEFAPHLQLLAECGYDGDPGDIVWTPPAERIAAGRRGA